VANRAGVGLGTVSRVLNNGMGVSTETRERVLGAIHDLNYIPNPSAQRLSKGKTLTVAVITFFFTRPAFVERLRGIENALAENGYDLVLYNVETPEKRDRYMRSIPRRNRVDGVIIVSLPPRDTEAEKLAKSSVPIVLVDANHPSLTMLNRVMVDDVGGGRKATEHLIELGHRRIGYISDKFVSPFNFTASYDRFTGYQHALTAAQIPFRAEYHGSAAHGRAEAYQLALTMLQLPERPTAIFAASDTQAMGVMEAARDLKLSVPEDVSVIGYDDIELAEYLGLTTVHQLLYESGRRGVELLMRLLVDNTQPPVCDLLPTQLMVRRTTAPPR
jgi:DNA-binding LacI/PurR family transcriptional regulator